MKYNKLVRDKIPEYIEQKGESVTYHIAEQEEYWELLKAKLLEEFAEFTEDESIEEFVDVLEVLEAIKAYKKSADNDIQQVKQEKVDKKGGFSKGVILDEA